MTNLNEMKTSELKKMAKDLKVKNWWLLKKSEMIMEIERSDVKSVKAEIKKPETKDEIKAEIKDEVKPEIKDEMNDEKKVTLNFNNDETPKDEVKPDEIKPTIVKEFTLATMLEEIDMNGKKARRILRTKKIEKPGKQWAWDNQESYDEIKALLLTSK